MLLALSQASKSAQVACFGQDTSIFYPREGKRPFRAQTPASDANKADGKAAVSRMREKFPLSSVTLASVQGRHDAYLKSLLAPGSGHSRSEVLRRLQLSKEAAARLHTLRVFKPNEHAICGCGDFISFLGVQPHGYVEKMVQKPKDEPYEVGKLSRECHAPAHMLGTTPSTSRRTQRRRLPTSFSQTAHLAA